MSENNDMGDSPYVEDDLPSNLILSKFCAARGREIQIMNKALSTSSSIKLAFQKLPKHMRRRAMSHNVKRLPRRLREIHLNQMKKSGLPPKAKRPSRKYRRRPYSLTDEFTRRQRRVTWLNTHIWHAKRFHMVEKWGYKLPQSGCDRAFRACYRATVKHCLLQDISYQSCIEISGCYDKIVSSFKTITSATVGLTIAAKSYIAGLREGRVMLFSLDAKKAIGYVDFQWRPANSLTLKRTLWMWIHAAYYKEALETLLTCLNLPRNSECTDTQIYSNEFVELKVLKWELSRLRLTGPLSSAVLHSAFRLADGEKSSAGWVKKYFQDISAKGAPSPNQYWESLKNTTSPAEISPHLLLPLIISDPRLNFPKKRVKALPSYTSESTSTMAENVYDSPLWDCSIRKVVQESKKSTAELAKLRENLLVPGSDLEDWGTCIPIILVQRPGKKSHDYRGYGSGWDIILPSVWTQPVWLSLNMWGARPGGLRETDKIDFEMGYPHCLNPDTSAGREEELAVSDKCKEIFFKLPPNKRTNFGKFRIASPLEWNWKLLLKEWGCEGSITEFFVLRDRGTLRTIQESMSSRKKNVPVPPLPQNCLIPVHITLSQKGLCKRFAIICLPEDGDIKLEPTESISPDPNEKLRKDMRTEHKTLLKRLRRRRIRAKKNGEPIPVDVDVLKNYNSKMRKLWLPEATGIRHSCSREVMGYVKHGDFSFLLAKSKAVGYITTGALVKLLASNCKNKVLVRNTTSRQYRLGTLEVICE